MMAVVARGGGPGQVASAPSSPLAAKVAAPRVVPATPWAVWAGGPRTPLPLRACVSGRRLAADVDGAVEVLTAACRSTCRFFEWCSSAVCWG